jgi:hypothetical protein
LISFLTWTGRRRVCRPVAVLNTERLKHGKA